MASQLKSGEGENEIYDRWLPSSGTERVDIEQQLYASVKQHAGCLVWERLGESNPDLVHEIASTIIRQLGGFRGGSKFSTWVQAIINNKIAEELRRRTRQRSRELLVGNDVLDEYQAPGMELDLVQEITLAQIAQSLPPNDLLLFRDICAGKDQDEIGEHFGITSEAADSRRRRFIRKCAEKFGLM